VDESLPAGIAPEEAVVLLAERKARAATPSTEPAIILASDTLVEADGLPLGKPTDAEDACRMLMRLSGRAHRVHTGVAVRLGERLLSVIQSVLATDTFGTDAEKIRIQIQSAESRRAKLLDVYVSGDISKEEFSEARAKCDAEIEGLQSAMERVDKQREMILQQQELFREIHKTVYELIGGVEYDDEFYRQILDKMVVVDREHIDVYLHSFPIRWRYAVSQASKSHANPSGNISDASLPTSVRIPTTCL
jgi:hypothetical protein